MNQIEEQKVLSQLLDAATQDLGQKWSWQAFALKGVAFCSIAVIAMWLFQNPHLADGPRVISLVAALFSGSIVGALSTWKLLCKNSAVVRKYIDTDRVKARLAELES